MCCIFARAKIRRLDTVILHFGIRNASLSAGFKTSRWAILEDDRLLGGFFCEAI